MNWIDFFTLLFISVTIISLFFISAIRIDFNIADEGYLYLGSLSLLKKQIPIRDFRAYDPGRYFWCALWMKLFSANLITIRAAMAFVMLISLMLSSWLIFNNSNSWLITVVGGLISYVWIVHFKAFEVFFSVLGVLNSFLILNDPSLIIYLESGFCVGIALFFGLNFALYLGAATIITFIISLFIQPNAHPMLQALDSGLTIGSAGFLLGATPTFFMFLKIPDYFKSYWERKVIIVLKRGTTNLPLSLPWLWTKTPHCLTQYTHLRQIFFKVIFTITPFAYLISLFIAVLTFQFHPKSSAIIIGAAVMGLVYLHHLFSRADVPHLCQAIHPFFILMPCILLSFTSVFFAFVFLFVFLLLSSWAIFPTFNPLYRYWRNSNDFSVLKTDKEFLILPQAQTRMFVIIRDFFNRYSKPDDAVLCVPLMPAFYVLFNRKPAIYDTFCVYPASQKQQEEMLACLQSQQVPLVVVFQIAADGRKELEFSYTHPLIWHYLIEKYERVSETDFPVDSYIWLLRKKTS